MMPVRAQLPAWSPVTVQTLAAGMAGMLRSDAARRALALRLRKYFGAQDAVLTDSGTSALAVGLAAAARARSGLPVALPAYSCWDLASAAVAAGVTVRLYDVDPTTLAPDYASLRRALDAGVSAVVVAHLYGLPVRADEAAVDVHAAGALLIEDIAQAFGAVVAGRPAGSTGDLAVLSFGRGKGLTGGRGGALLVREETSISVDEPSLPASTRGTAELITLAALWLLGRPVLYSLPASMPRLRLGETMYREPHAPAQQSGASAAAVNAGWEASLLEVEIRRRHAARLADAVPETAEIAGDAGVRPSFLRLPLRLADSTVVRGNACARSLGIFRGYPIALCDLQQLRASVAEDGGEYPGARELARGLVTLPTHSRLREADLTALERWIVRTRRTARPTAAIAGSE